MTDKDQEIVVMDVEWTAWAGSRQRMWSGPREEMELVQIGAVKLADDDGLPEIDAFEILIKPRINANIDEYFVDLTGITQSDLDRNGLDLREALSTFEKFLGSVTKHFGFGDELQHIVVNCQLYGMVYPFSHLRCRDVRPQVIELLGIDHVPNSSDLPHLLNFSPPGVAHQGLSDSRCIAEALRRLRQDGKF